MPGANLAIGMGGRRAGLRRDLPAGPLTRGPLYDVFDFDNRVVTLAMTGAQVQQAQARELTHELPRSRRGIPSVSGIRVRVTCAGERRELEIVRPSGVPVGPEETLVVATTDSFARRAARDATVVPPAAALASAPLVRDAVADWPGDRGGLLSVADFVTPAALGNARGRHLPRQRLAIEADSGSVHRDGLVPCTSGRARRRPATTHQSGSAVTDTRKSRFRTPKNSIDCS